MAFTSAVVTQALTATLSGTTDFTSSGFGTPDAAILIYSNARTGVNPQGGAAIGIGLWDGTNQCGAGLACTDAVGTSGTARSQRNDYIAPIPSTSSDTWSAGYQASAITDGIRLTMAQDNTTFARFCTVVLLKGISAALLTMTPNATQDGTATSSSLGFEPGALIALAVGVAGNTADSGSARSTPASISYGAALADGTHRSVGWSSAHNAADAAVVSLFSETRLATVVQGSSLTFGLEVTSWDADDFTITTRDGGTGGATVAVLALGGADLAAVLGTITTATSTGAVDTTTTGVDPDVVLLAMTSSDTAGSVKTDAQASSLSAGAASSTVNAGFAIVDEDAAAAMNNESEHSATDALLIRTSTGGTGSTLVAADLSMGTGKFTVDYATVDATARKGWFLAIGQGTGGGDVTAPVLSSPTGAATGSTAATVGATTDEGNGTLYAFVSTSATPPSGTDLKAGTGATWAGSVAVSSTGAKTLNATGLTASTGYYAHLIHTDAAANDSNIVTSAQFTTTAANAAPSWSGTPSAMSSKRGQALTPQDITSLVSDADLDTLAYTITGAPTGVTINSSTGVISGTPTAAPGVYACAVQADDGIASPVASSSFNITVQQGVLALNAAGYEFGDGNAAATMAVVASTELQVAVYPITEWPPASAIATATATTGTNGRLADLGDDDLSHGTTYRVIARNAADGETWAWTMAAS